MILPKQLTTVTRLSKILALILFVTLPFIGFLLGIRYQAGLTVVKIEYVKQDAKKSTTPTIVVPTSKPNPTTIPTGWKTYQNDTCHYSLSYPSDWIVKENCGISGTPENGSCIQTKDYDGGYGVTINRQANGHLVTVFCDVNRQENTQDIMNSCLKDNIISAQKNLGTIGICNSVDFGGYYFVSSHKFIIS